MGPGTVGEQEQGRITVAFDDAGYKTLDAALVAELGLLDVLERAGA